MNPITKPYQTVEQFDISQITTVFQIRSLQGKVVSQISERITQEGFYPDSHLILNRENGTIELLSGNHRFEAAKHAGIQALPVILYTDLTHGEKLRIARQANNNAETLAKTTFVDDAEMVWRELKHAEMTQEKLAESLGNGWSRDKVKNYQLLSKVGKKAWSKIGTQFSHVSPIEEDEDVPEIGTHVPISEGLLRKILSIKPCRQYDLFHVSFIAK